MDDWQDDRNLIRGTYGVVLHQAGRRVSGQYPDQSEMIRQCLEELKQAELRNEADLDLVSGLFGRICGALFAPEKDIWYQDLPVRRQKRIIAFRMEILLKIIPGILKIKKNGERTDDRSVSGLRCSSECL